MQSSTAATIARPLARSADPYKTDPTLTPPQRSSRRAAKGDEFMIGFDPSRLAPLVGLDRERRRSRFPGHELVARSRAILGAAARYARQLRPVHLDYAIPGMEDVDGPLVLPDGTALFHDDGRPFLPHRTSLGLVRHILSHGLKFAYMAEHPDVGLTDLAFFGLLGEPSEDVTVDWLVDELGAAADRTARW